jgi:hypothetical protein
MSFTIFSTMWQKSEDKKYAIASQKNSHAYIQQSVFDTKNNRIVDGFLVQTELTLTFANAEMI